MRIAALTPFAMLCTAVLFVAAVTPTAAYAQGACQCSITLW